MFRHQNAEQKNILYMDAVYLTQMNIYKAQNKQKKRLFKNKQSKKKKQQQPRDEFQWDLKVLCL